MMKKRTVALLLALCFLVLPLSSCQSRWGKLGEEAEAASLPTLTITTEGGAQIVSRSEYLNMTLVLSGIGEEQTFLSGRIRGRGNSTWDFCEKKSYRLKLDLKTNLLFTGDGGDKDWALISCAREKSFLRNFAMFALAKELGMAAVTDCSFCHLELNGEYMGLYMLTETVELGKSRLDLEDEGEEEDKAYLLELDKRAKSEAESPYEYFYVNDWEIPFAIKSKVSNEAQRDFIKDYVERVDDAILSGDREAINALADVESLVDMYLLQEFSKNRDVGFASFYLYKDKGGRLTAGFPWDFDMALGNDSGEDRLAEKDSPKINYKDPEGLMAAVLNRWFEALCKNEWFMTLCADRWEQTVSPAVDKIVKKTVLQGYAMKNDAKRNYDRWAIMGKKQLFEPARIVMIRGYTGQVDYLADWMTDRRKWLDEYFEKW
ncbi:MAG: CotH kinase family protein [Clostridia bacterium]|nr:CotH kinase family protein [Clostridia bacterium]